MSTRSIFFCVPDFRDTFGIGHLARQCTLVKTLSKNHRNAYLTLPDHILKDSIFLPWLTKRINKHLLLGYSDAHALRRISDVCIRVIIDSYDFEYIASNFGCDIKRDKLTVIDDLAHERKYSSNILAVIPNICSQHQVSMVMSNDCNSLSYMHGPQYILLDPEFLVSSKTRETLLIKRQTRLTTCVEGKKSLTLLIGFGGSGSWPDEQSKTNFSRFLQQIHKSCTEVKIHCLGDSAFSFCSTMGISAHNLGWLDLGELRRAYLEADVYFGSIGYSMWERASLFLPSFVTPIAKNQISYAITGEELGIHRIISETAKGEWLSDTFAMLESTFKLKINDSGYFSLFS